MWVPVHRRQHAPGLVWGISQQSSYRRTTPILELKHMPTDVLSPEQFRAERSALLAHPSTDPTARRALLTALTERWVQQLFGATGAPGGVALVAVGGFGRRELAPGSDVDLVLLHAPRVSFAQIADQLWYPIWDSGVKLDHSVRTPVQARRMANSDLKVMLGLLDARTLAGDQSLLAGLQESALSDWRAKAASRLSELRAMRETRRDTFGELAYLQEPDLKESIGGLRDVVIMRAIAASWVTDVPRAHIRAPYNLLLDVRDTLHVVTGRGSDRLVRQEQPTVAERLNIADPGADGDGLLRAVAAAGRTIDWASDMTWHRVDRLGQPSRLPGRRLLSRSRADSASGARTPLAEGAVIADGEVVLARDARPDRDRGLVVRMAAATARAGLRIAPATVTRLAETAALPKTPWSDAVRNDFVSFIGAGRGFVPVWEALDQSGLITQLLPEWEVTRSAPQHNPVHVFTVDRHMLETAVHAASASRQVSRPDLLLTAALLHDIGKPAGAAQHSEVGARIVAELAPRMGFAPADVQVLVSLVRHHLLLAETATRRDIHDPATVRMVAQAVANPEVLELLWALTRADAQATGPAAWSPWKGALVAGLVENVARVFTGHTAAVPPTLSEAEQVAAAADDVVVLRDERGGLEEIVIGTPPAPLSDVAVVLALHRLRVIEARATYVDDRLVSTWRVTPAFGEAPDAHRIAVDVRRVLGGSLDVPRRITRPVAGGGGPAAPDPVVTILPDASAAATVIEVRAADATGLLYRLLHTIDVHDAQVRAAKVATLGIDVVDVFYLVDRSGAPLSPATATAVQQDLWHAAVIPAERSPGAESG